MKSPLTDHVSAELRTFGEDQRPQRDRDGWAVAGRSTPRETPRRRPGFAESSHEFMADGASGGAVVGMMIGPDC
ncbi:hypothetical protein NL676_010226 [Syzygium grande]|nr:hypothetical protein NL676_010226 [Syzygium grande]